MPKQMDLPTVEKSAMSKLAEDYLEALDRITEMKQGLQEVAEQIINQLEVERRSQMKLNVNGQTFVFRITPGKDKLVCSRARQAA